VVRRASHAPARHPRGTRATAGRGPAIRWVVLTAVCSSPARP